jgi:nucleoside-diphosphate-sugar epimerase
MNKIIKEDIENILTEPLPWEKLSGKTVLVTGASSGFLAYAIYALLELGNVDVIAVVRNKEKAKKLYEDYLSNPKLTIFQHDLIGEFNTERSPCRTKQIDYFICGAILSSPEDRAKYGENLIVNNVSSLHNTLIYAARFVSDGRAPTLLLTSSNSVYGQPLNADMIGESDYGYLDPLTPHAPYSESKRIQEAMIVAAGVQFGFETRISRSPNMIGPNMARQFGNALSDFIDNALNNLDITILSDGLLNREYIYFQDAASALFYILLKGENAKPYNIGYQELITIREAAREIVKVFNDKVKLKILNGAYSQNAPLRNFRLNAARLNALGWKPKYNIRTAITRVAEFYRS